MKDKNNELPEASANDAGQTKAYGFISSLKANYKFILIPLVLIGGYFAYKKYKK